MVQEPPQIVVHDDFPPSVKGRRESYESEDEDDAGDALLSSKRSIAGQTNNKHSPAPTSKAALVKKALTAAVLLLCGVSLRSLIDSVPLARLSRAADRGPSADGSSICNPYHSYGRLNASFELSEVKWMPVHEEEGCEVVDYMAKLQSVIAGEEDESIDFVRGKTILVLGDSVDRNHIRHMCVQLSGDHQIVNANDELSPAYPDGQEFAPEGHASAVEGGTAWRSNGLSRPHYCYVQSLDLLLLNTFHFGFRDSDTFLSDSCHYYPPARVEARASLISVPLLENLARKYNRSAVPDIVTLTAGYWGMQRAAKDDEAGLRAAVEAGADGGEVDQYFNKWRAMPEDFAGWYENRAEEILRHIGSLWANAPERPRILWRVLHRTQKWDDIPATRRAGIDQITREVVQELIGEAKAAHAGSEAWNEWAKHHQPRKDRPWHGLDRPLSLDEKQLNAEELDFDRRLFVNTWGDKIDGMQFRKSFFLDSIHPGRELSYLYGNMVLEELREEVLLREMEKRAPPVVEEVPVAVADV